MHGALRSSAGEPRGIELLVEDRRFPARAQRMPSPGLARELGHGAGRAFFWGFAVLAPESRRIAVRASVAGRPRAVELGSVEPASAPEPAAAPGRLDPRATVAICMATHEPRADLLGTQIDSLRAQTHRDWVCLISDDASSASASAELRAAIGDDPRFVLSRSDRRLGPYENFHRALRMVPADVAYVALCDQDDRWHAGKLEALIDALGEAPLAYGDMRLVGPEGEVIADTYWTRRRPSHANFASLLLTNSVTGAAALFRRSLLDLALPLPPRVGNLYHDHWLALVAASVGEIAYVPRPLQDYVQHPGAVLGHAGANRGVVGGSPLRRLLAKRGQPAGTLRRGWRELYFGEYCRLLQCATVLEARLGDRLDRGRRRALSLALAADTSAPRAAWLVLRQVRRLVGDETLGGEAAMLRGLAWRNLIRVGRSGDPYDDADLPPGIVDPVEAVARDGASERASAQPITDPDIQGA